jgi:hypothetical protein
VQQQTKKVLKLKAIGFKPHPTPSHSGADDEHYQQYSFKFLADADLIEALGPEMLDEQGWARVNPRGRTKKGPVLDAIETTWMEYGEEFYRINRGIVLSAESITWDKSTSTVEIVLSDKAKHGIVDGAHSLAKVVDDLIPETYGLRPSAESEEEAAEGSAEENGGSEGPPVDRYMTCEVWVGLSSEELARLTEGRNTSRTVPPYAISNLRGDFQPLIERLQVVKKDYFDKVAFKPDEHMEPTTPDEEKNYKPIPAMSILQLMMCMDISNYTDTDQPLEAFKNKGYAARFWNPDAEDNRIDEYKKMLPIVGDMLELYDRVREVVPEVYDGRVTHRNKIPRRWNKVLAKEKDRVETSKNEVLYYVDPTGKRKTFRAPISLFFPMVCAFRACLKLNGDKYEWVGGKPPTEWKDSTFRAACLELAVMIAAVAKDKDSLHAVGRDQAVWTTCYKTIDSFLYEYGIKSKRAQS